VPGEDAAQFHQIVLAADELPAWVRENVGNARSIDQHVLNQSYLDFLKEQISLSLRGPKWSEEMQKRHDILAPLRGKKLMSGIIIAGADNCYLKLDPEAKRVLYWDIYQTKKKPATP
jgi:hypothetical protein